MKKHLYSLLGVLCFVNGYSQVDTVKIDSTPISSSLLTSLSSEVTLLQSESFRNNNITNINPVSPNTFAFAKYADNPVSQYTGVPSISIPLGKISEKGASIDISLSYHGSGIKVDEIASWVGLGWSLNAGGIVTRAVFGQPEYPGNNGELLPSRVDPGFPEGTESDGRFSRRDLDTLYLVYTGQRDAEPDIFYYNFNGRSGKFVLTENGEVLFFKYEDLKVEFVKKYPSGGNNETNAKFIITDENGVKYTFDFIETLYSGKLYPTAWYLTKVESPQGGVITLTYGSQYHKPYVNYKLSQLVGEGKSIYNNNYWMPTPNVGNSLESILQSITTSGSERVDFKVDDSTSRLDYASQISGKPLDQIVFYDAQNSIVKKVNFFTSYFISAPFTSDQFLGTSNYAYYEHLRYRLKLDSLTILSGSNQSEHPPYRFEYYSDLSNSIYDLPFRLSPNQDHWGYYNAANNKTLVPRITWEITAGYWLNRIMNMTGSDGDLYSTGAFTGGANKDPNSEAVKACSLRKIYYPTGGYTVFDFEINTYDGGVSAALAGGLRIASIKDYTGSNVLSRERIFKYTWFDSENNPPFSIFSSGSLIDDPRKYYVLIGRGRYNIYGGWEIFDSELSTLFGSEEDWNNALGGPNGFVYKVSSVPQAVLGATHGQSVGYSSVVEYEQGNGYTEYSFSDPSEFPNCWTKWDYFSNDVPMDIFESQYSTTISSGGWFPGSTALYRVQHEVECNQFPFLNQYDNDWKRGNLKSVKRYNENRKLIFSQENEYYLINQKYIPGYKVFMTNNESECIHGKYYVSGNWVALKKQTTVHRDVNGNNPVTTISDFEYNSIAHKFLSKEKTYDSQNNLIESRYRYPQDYNSTLSALVNNHIIGKPIDIRTYNGSRLISGSQTKYNDYGQPVELYNFESSANDIAFNVTQPFTFTKKQVINYNTEKNPDKVDHVDNLKTYYLWAYNGEYPIAKIESSNADLIISTIQTSINSNLSLSGSDDKSQIDTDLTKIRTALSGIMSGNFVSIYTYQPLVGMTSETDPAGRTLYYEYDSFGRLKLVRDQNGNIVRKHDYHYAGQSN